MYPKVDLSCKIPERLVVWRYVSIVIVANLIHYKIVEGQRGIDDVEVAGKELCVPLLMTL